MEQFFFNIRNIHYSHRPCERIGVVFRAFHERINSAFILYIFVVLDGIVFQLKYAGGTTQDRLPRNWRTYIVGRHYHVADRWHKILCTFQIYANRTLKQFNIFVGFHEYIQSGAF